MCDDLISRIDKEYGYKGSKNGNSRSGEQNQAPTRIRTRANWSENKVSDLGRPRQPSGSCSSQDEGQNNHGIKRVYQESEEAPKWLPKKRELE